MVSSKEKAREQFATWFNLSLTRIGIVEGRGRPQAVAKRYRVTVPAARKWLTGKSVPDSARMLTIVEDIGAEASSYPTSSALGEITATSHVREPDHAIVAAREIIPGYVRLPLLAMEGGMGNGIETEQGAEVVQFLDVAEWWAQINLPKPLDRVKIITGRGDSNAPMINHGDIVFVDTRTSYFDGDGFYVFNWNGRALIKRLVPNLRTGRLQIVSGNPAIPSEDIEPGEIDQLHIAGRVSAWYTLRHY